MLILNGNKFALNDEEYTNSLFLSGGTCVGYYKPLKASITILDHNKDKIGVINKYGVLCKATKQDFDTKYHYSYGDIKQVGEYASYSQEVEEVEQAMHDNNIVKQY